MNCSVPLLGCVLLLLTAGCRTSAPRAASGPGAVGTDVAGTLTLLDGIRDRLGGPQEAAAQRELAQLTRQLEAQVAASPSDAKAHFALGRAHLYAERYAEASAAFARATELAPEVADHQFFHGYLLELRKDLAGAEQALRRSTELAPQRARNWEELAYVLALRERLQPALEAVERALSLEPDSTRALFTAASLLALLEREEEALKLYARLQALEPKSFYAHYNDGQIHQNREESAQALARFQAASEIDPEDWHTHGKLAQLYQATGQLPARDRELAQVRKLWREGKVGKEHPTFCREQFRLGTQKVMVFESFELKGERAVRYAFELVAPDGKSSQRTISLGSYDFTNRAAQRPEDKAHPHRLFHLDGYDRDGSHQTYAFFDGEPSYEEVRSAVVAILEGKLKPGSSMTPRRE